MNVTKTAASQHSKTYEMTVTALMTAVTCILAPRPFRSVRFRFLSQTLLFIFLYICSDGNAARSVIWSIC